MNPENVIEDEAGDEGPELWDGLVAAVLAAAIFAGIVVLSVIWVLLHLTQN